MARDGRLSVRRTDDAAGLIEHAAMLRVDFGADVEAWPTDQVREVLRSPHYFQARALRRRPSTSIRSIMRSGSRRPPKKHGARIFENTPALSLDPAGVRKRDARRRTGMVRARHVVLAGATGIGAVDAPIAATVLPVSTYVAVTAPLGEKLFDAVRYTGAVADTRRAGDYYRIVARRPAAVGRAHHRRAARRRGGSRPRCARDILKVYPQLGGVEIEYAWAGTMAYAVHKMPQIGELAPGYWLASAFGGHGLNTTAMAGEMIARAILEGDDRWRLFSSYELVWAGGAFGRAAAQTVAAGRCRRATPLTREDRALSRPRAARGGRAAGAMGRPSRRSARPRPRRAAPRRRRRRIAEQEARRLAAEEAAPHAAAECARLRRRGSRAHAAGAATRGRSGEARRGGSGARSRRAGDARCGRSRRDARAQDRGVQGGDGRK